MTLCVTCQRVSDPGEVLGWERTGNDEHTCVRLTGVREGDGDGYEIVPVASHKAPAVRGCEAQLLIVWQAVTAQLVGAGYVQAQAPRDVRDGLREILIQVEAECGRPTPVNQRSGVRITGRMAA